MSYYRSPSSDLIYDPTSDRYIPVSDLSVVYTQDDAPISRDPVFNNKGVLTSYVDSYNDTDMTITIDEDPSVVYTRNLDKNFTWNKTLNKYVGGYKTLTIIPDPEDATVELTATGYVQDGNSISAEEGTVVNWTVSKQGFPSKSGTITLTHSQVLHISLYYEAKENEAIVDLEGAQAFEENTIFTPGRYEVYIQAPGGGVLFLTEEDSAPQYDFTTTIEVENPFIVKAYCASSDKFDGSGNIISVGKNPYSGPFKVNYRTAGGTPPYVNHIFGNAGSIDAGGRISIHIAGGNCLSDGYNSNLLLATAGVCMHIMPPSGVFGTDYYYTFQIAGCADGGGNGSAYGGAASGGASDSWLAESYSTSAGGSTPYGQGGAGVYKYVTVENVQGNPGTGVGHGVYAGPPAAASFNGTEWVDMELRSRTITTAYEDGKIRITYLGPLNS